MQSAKRSRQTREHAIALLSRLTLTTAHSAGSCPVSVGCPRNRCNGCWTVSAWRLYFSRSTAGRRGNRGDIVAKQRSHGSGSLYKRSDSGCWIACYSDHSGKRRERSTRTTDKATAGRILAKWIEETALRT